MLPAYAGSRSLHGPYQVPKIISPLSENVDHVNDGDVVEIKGAGVRFRWNKYHKKPVDVRAKRLEGDPLADAAISEILLNEGGDRNTSKGEGKHKHKHDFYALCNARAEALPSGPCASLLRSVNSSPTFKVDWESVRRGQDFFLRRAPSTSIALLHLSLVGGFSSPGINEVLYGTGYLMNSKPSVVQLRLFETMAMVIDCMAGGPETLMQGGKGLESVTRVRLLHAFVRRRLQRRMQGWNTERDGVPINQGDMAITGLSFSINVIFGCEALGCPASPADIRDYVHLWKVISDKIGVLPAHNPHSSFEEAVAALESYIITCINPNESSVRATSAVLHGVSNQPPFYMSFQRMASLSRLCLGDTLANALQLPQYTLSDKFFLILLKSLLKVQSAIADCYPRHFSKRGSFAIRRNLRMLLGEKGTKTVGKQQRQQKQQQQQQEQQKQEQQKQEQQQPLLTRFGGYDDEESERSRLILEENLSALENIRKRRLEKINFVKKVVVGCITSTALLCMVKLGAGNWRQSQKFLKNP
mmetsp:Transcript_16456/g.33910  ORF Transcript_16456/g.33910 Transcript_16456/m.33910 type:complete len:529 (-) Transcript_16456:167-1753(-)